jgi:hypothetical protein
MPANLQQQRCSTSRCRLQCSLSGFRRESFLGFDAQADAELARLSTNERLAQQLLASADCQPGSAA